MEQKNTQSSPPVGKSQSDRHLPGCIRRPAGFWPDPAAATLLRQEFGASSTLVGLLVASYAAAQLVGAPILGRLSDRYGRRPVLLVSILGTAIGFVMLAVAVPLGTAISNALFGAESQWQSTIILAILFASRILDGLTGGNISVAQAYIADVTDESNRAKGLGPDRRRVWPGLHHRAGRRRPSQRLWLCRAGHSGGRPGNAEHAGNLLLPARIGDPGAACRDGPSSTSQPSTFVHCSRRFVRPRVGPLFQIRFLFGMAFSMFQSIFALYAAGAPLGLTPKGTGFVLTYVGVLAVFVQGFAVGRLARAMRTRA